MRTSSGLTRMADLSRVLPLNTDSYKHSHWLQYPPGTQHVFSYIESRGGVHDRTVFFGLQYILKEYFSDPVTLADIDLAEEVTLAHGEPFHRAGWDHIVRVHGGRLPVRICAVPEGSVVPVRNVLLTVENTDPACYWLPSFLETILLRVWYPTTVATNSWMARQLIRAYLEKTGDPSGLDFKLHDFGARGVSSLESAAIGGLAHLVNFKGTDTMAALLAARTYYHEPLAAFSVPAAEHATITSWGRASEVDAYRNMLTQFAKPGAIVSVVSDSYDLEHAVKQLWGGELKQPVIDSGATLVIRPDSGDPATIVLRVAHWVDQTFGSERNDKGYKVLRNVRILQGDGITLTSIRDILDALERGGFSADNVVFGQGGALLQQVNRDDQRFAQKASAVNIDGQWREIYKDPVTDPGKRSKAGRLTLLRRQADFLTLRQEDPALPARLAEGWRPVLDTVFENGELLIDETLATIRTRAAVKTEHSR